MTGDIAVNWPPQSDFDIGKLLGSLQPSEISEIFTDVCCPDCQSVLRSRLLNFIDQKELSKLDEQQRTLAKSSTSRPHYGSVSSSRSWGSRYGHPLRQKGNNAAASSAPTVLSEDSMELPQVGRKKDLLPFDSSRLLLLSLRMEEIEKSRLGLMVALFILTMGIFLCGMEYGENGCSTIDAFHKCSFQNRNEAYFACIEHSLNGYSFEDGKSKVCTTERLKHPCICDVQENDGVACKLRISLRFACLIICFAFNCGCYQFITHIRGFDASQVAIRRWIRLIVFLVAFAICIVSFYASPHTITGALISLIFIVWAWVIEISLNIKTRMNVSLIIAMTSHAYILSVSKRNPSAGLLVFMPIILSLVLYGAGVLIRGDGDNEDND